MMSIETRDGNFQISLEDEGREGHLLVHRQGPSGQALVSALTPEQLVEMLLGPGSGRQPQIPEEIRRVLEEQSLEIVTESVRSRQRASVSRHAEYKDHRSSGILKTASATGRTRDEAVRSLIQELSGKLLVIDAYRASRHEIQMPELAGDETRGDETNER